MSSIEPVDEGGVLRFVMTLGRGADPIDGGGGTSDYEKLQNLPSVNDVTLKGNKTGDELQLQEKMKEISETDIDAMFDDSSE